MPAPSASPHPARLPELALLAGIEERLEHPSARGIAEAVTRAMRDGVLAPGVRLPPIRTVAEQLQLSPTTVSAGWALLARSGAITTDGRRGTTVADIRAAGPTRYRRALRRHTVFDLDLSTGVPDPALLPDLGPAMAALHTAPVPDSYLDDPVLPELVELLRADWPYPAESLTVVDGAMDALDLAATALLRFGDRVIVEHPCFPPLIDLLETMRVEIVPVALDDEGMMVSALTTAVAAPVAAVFLQPRAQNPTGVSLTTARAAQLSTVISQTGACVIEDDSAGAVSAVPDISLGTFIPQQTLHVRSFSKSHGPDLRLAAVSGPEALLAKLIGRRHLGQGWTSRLLQRILVHLLADEKSVSTVRRARAEYAHRRETLVRALAVRGVHVGGNDGINIWVPVVDESAALLRLASQGIGVAPGAPFGALPGPVNHVRVTAGLLTGGDADIVDIADIIADAALADPYSPIR